MALTDIIVYHPLCDIFLDLFAWLLYTCPSARDLRVVDIEGVGGGLERKDNQRGNRCHSKTSELHGAMSTRVSNSRICFKSCWQICLGLFYVDSHCYTNLYSANCGRAIYREPHNTRMGRQQAKSFDTSWRVVGS